MPFISFHTSFFRLAMIAAYFCGRAAAARGIGPTSLASAKSMTRKMAKTAPHYLLDEAADS